MSRPEPRSRLLTRGQLLRLAGVSAAAVAVAGRGAPFAFAGPMRYSRRALKNELSIVQWNHFMPGYDTWFDETWATTWGEANDTQVTVDHVDYTRLPALAAAEVKAQRGHDIFGFLKPPTAFEDQVIDHTDIVSQVESVVGPYSELGRKSTFNPRTRAYFGVSDSYVPDPMIWRHDLWNSIGESPATWDHVLSAAPKLKAIGHPIGIGQSNEPDSSLALLSFLMCFGAFVQDESNAPTLASQAAVDAVQFMADLYTSGEESQVFRWNATSNNQYLLSGKSSMIMNAISVLRTAEGLELPFSDDLWLWPIPTGPQGRLGLGQYTSVYSVWRFSENQAAAEKFIADLCINYQPATLASQLYNFPSFPGAVPLEKIYATAAADPNLPRGKYSILTTVATKHTRNLGYPGYANAAVDEMLSKFLIPRMFAQVSQGKVSAAESVRGTSSELKRIWKKWKAAGKL